MKSRQTSEGYARSASKKAKKASKEKKNKETCKNANSSLDLIRAKRSEKILLLIPMCDMIDNYDLARNFHMLHIF